MEKITFELTKEQAQWLQTFLANAIVSVQGNKRQIELFWKAWDQVHHLVSLALLEDKVDRVGEALSNLQAEGHENKD